MILKCPILAGSQPTQNLQRGAPRALRCNGIVAFPPNLTSDVAGLYTAASALHPLRLSGPPYRVVLAVGPDASGCSSTRAGGHGDQPSGPGDNARRVEGPSPAARTSEEFSPAFGASLTRFELDISSHVTGARLEIFDSSWNVLLNTVVRADNALDDPGVYAHSSVAVLAEGIAKSRAIPASITCCASRAPDSRCLRPAVSRFWRPNDEAHGISHSIFGAVCAPTVWTGSEAERCRAEDA